MEQRANIKFSHKLETREMLMQVYGRDTVSRKCVYEWFKRFCEGKESTEDERGSCGPGTRSATDAKIDCGGIGQ